MSLQHKKIIALAHCDDEKKHTIDKSRASKQEVMTATKRGIDKYRETLKNLSKR